MWLGFTSLAPLKLPTKQHSDHHDLLNDHIAWALFLANTIPPNYTTKKQTLCNQDSLVLRANYQMRDSSAQDQNY